MLLEDDIELSPYFYIYLKLALLLYAYSDADAAPSPLAEQLLGIALYTPRLVEVRMPRRRIDLHSELRGAAPSAYTKYTPPVHLQQLPCSWGSLFFPVPCREFHRYMHRRLHGKAAAVQIPYSATNGWSTSWKKFLIELCFLRGWVVLYPNFHNQTSFSTNHLEPGEHIGGKANTLKHRPIDFVVPLMHSATMLRQLWRGAAGELCAPQPLSELPVLDLFSERTSQAKLIAQGRAAISQQSELAAAVEGLRSEPQSAQQQFVTNLRLAVSGWL